MQELRPMAMKFKLVYLTICDCELSDEMNLWIYEVWTMYMWICVARGLWDGQMNLCCFAYIYQKNLCL